MIALTAEEAGKALGLGPLAGGISAVSTDSRSIRPGELFVALRGERFDGHEFVDAALMAGACGAVVDERFRTERLASGWLSSAHAERCVYQVPDTTWALGALARAVRRKSRATVVAITGSVGKTSTKDLVGAMAARVCRVGSTAANQNNEVGVPLTLLAIEPDTQMVVVEMGMRGRGQIAALARIAEPDMGVITNIHPVHLELLGTLEDVAEAKAELLTGLAPAGVAVLPAGSPFLLRVAERADVRIVRFGFGPGSESAEVHGSTRALETGEGAVLSLWWPEGQVEIETSSLSRHRMENTVAAAAACYAAGLPLERCVAGVADVRFAGSRGDVMRLGSLCVINDTYNANPAAVRAALDDLVDLAARYGGRPVAVLGDMLELGAETERYHREAGAYAAEAGVRALWGVGAWSRWTVEGYRTACDRAPCDRAVGDPAVGASPPGVEAPWAATVGWVDSAEKVSTLMAVLQPGDVVLFKGSRSMKLEIMVDRVVEAAKAGAWGAPPGGEPRPDGTTRRRRS
jgi:UDP-N-acetylmuramoyl-tripeptide--D-alanyl-D-alanine ligase